MARQSAATKPTPLPREAPAQWMNRGNAVYLEGRAHIDGVDQLAMEMERTWGAGRLRLLVDAEWREKFDRQRVKLNKAVWEGDLEDVCRETSRMASAWRKLHALATDLGASQQSPQVWETVLDDGRVVAIVQTISEAHTVAADGRRVDVYSLEEIGRIIQGFPEISQAKVVFPGATVIAVREPNDPLRSIELDDSIPF
jgi:hypothetical protein